MWALGGEFIRDLHSDSSLRKKPVELVLRQMIEYGGPSSITARKISRDHSIPRAASSTASSPRPRADACRHPQIPPTRLKNNHFSLLALAILFFAPEASAAATHKTSTKQRVTVSAELFFAEVFFT